MNFELTEAQQIFFDAVQKYAQNELADGALARANSDQYPWDIAARFADFGLLGITIPEQEGGKGGTLTDAVLAIQAVASVCPRSADVVQAGNFGAIRTFAEYATAEQVRQTSMLASRGGIASILILLAAGFFLLTKVDEKKAKAELEVYK